MERVFQFYGLPPTLPPTNHSEQVTMEYANVTMNDMNSPLLLNAHEDVLTDNIKLDETTKTSTSVIYHLSFPAILLWQFHLVLSMHETPGPGVCAPIMDSCILLFAVSGFIYRYAYRPYGVLRLLPELITNAALVLILVERADLAFTALLTGIASLCITSSIIVVTRLLITNDYQQEEFTLGEEQVAESLTACQIV